MIQEYEIRKVPLSIIKLDESNPNVMSEEQVKGLKLTMEKYGYLQPVILNKDFTVIDGEHRVKLFQDLDKQEIPAYVVDIDNIDSKMLRQLMNKLHGEHDSKKDVEEFKSIFDENKLEDFANLLGEKHELLEKVIEDNVVERSRNSDRYDVSQDYYVNGVVKQIILFVENDLFEEIIPKLDKYMEKMNIDNHSDLFLEFFRYYERNNPV
mgnify:CR=1 FL=1